MKMRRYKKYLIWVAGILLLFTIVGFFVLPPVLKSVMTSKMSQALDRPVSIGAIEINPYLLKASIRGFRIGERGSQNAFVSFDEFRMQVDATSIFRRALIVKEVRLVKPYARITRHADGSYNFSDLLLKFGKKDKEEKKSGPFHFSVNNIRIERGALDFADEPAQTNHKVTDLTIAIPFISNTAYQVNLYTQPVLSARINGTLYAFRGKSKPFADSHETSLDIDITDLDIPFYLAYVPVKLQFKMPSGLLSTKVQMSYIQYRDKKPSLDIKGDLMLRKLALDDPKSRPMIRVPALDVSMASVQPFARDIHFSKILLTAPDVSILRDAAGKMNLSNLAPAPAGKSPAIKEAKAAPQPAAKDAPVPLVVRVDEFRIAEGKMAFRDQKPSQPVALAVNNLSLLVKDYTTVKQSKALVDLSFGLDRRGQFAAAGPVGLDPLTADLKLQIRTIDIRPFQPYFTDKIKINLTGGNISALGNVALKNAGTGKGLTARYTGNLLVSDFGSIDKANADDFLKWKALFFKDMQVGYNPLSIDIRQVSLANFFARIIINPDGSMNLQNIVEKEESASGAAEMKKAQGGASKPGEQAKAESQKIKIDAVTLQGGTIDFTDRNVKPNYTANLSQIGGRVSGLSSIGEKAADVELRGQFDNRTPLEITGKINPLAKNFYADLKTSFRNMELSSISPYTARHIGYNIEKGKLSFDLKYKIENKNLSAENKIFFDQLTLGDKVESPKATKLPVGLAIALLKDRKGEINLDIPVAGKTDDPQFSVWRIVVQVLMNLVTKAATAPFALLGSLFGGGEELSYVDFDYGHSDITDANQKKIDALVKALYERPSLKLDIEGHADRDQDREGLKQAALERKVKTAKLNDMIRQGVAAVPVDSVRVDPPEYEKYLTQAYRAEPFPKPRTAIGLIQTLPKAEMEKLILTHAVVGEGDLKRLAAQRASTVYQSILKSGKVNAERVFIIEPKSLVADKKEKVKDSRIDFKLK